MDRRDFKRISSLPPPASSQKSKHKSKYSTLRTSLTSHKEKLPTMASSSRKPPSRGGALSYITATFYRRGPDSSTKAALSELRKAESALCRVMQVGNSDDPEQRQLVLERAITTVQILQRRVARYAEMVDKVAEWEQRMRERMDELDEELAEANRRRLKFESEGEEVRNEIARIQKEIEGKKLVESGEESGSEDCDKPKDRICIRTLASGDWDDTLDDDEF